MVAMDQQNELSAQSSLVLIESMINKAQNRFSENGTLYLIWGWVVFICALGQYLMLKLNGTNFKQSGFIWLIIIPVIIYQFFFLVKKKKAERVKTYTDEIIGYVWMTFGICMGLFSYIMAVLQIWQLFYPFIFLFYGIPTFLSGAIMRFKPLMVGGITCWILALISVQIQTIEIILLLIPAVLAGWIIPGYLLRARFKSA